MKLVSSDLKIGYRNNSLKNPSTFSKLFLWKSKFVLALKQLELKLGIYILQLVIFGNTNKPKGKIIKN